MRSTRSSASWTASEPTVLAAGLAALYLVLAPATGDHAAAEYRAWLGWRVWDDGWYGGHHVPGYSVLLPLLSGPLGARLTGALAAVAAAWAFARLVRDQPGGRAGALWFAAGTATLLITGRIPFVLGTALALGAALALTRGRTALAALLAVLAGLGSPVAGAFLALAAAAWWLDRPRRGPVIVACAAVIPAALVVLAFPEGGPFPFEASSFWPALAATVLLAVLLRGVAPRALLIGAALYAAVLVASFVLSTPMGGNAARLGALLAGPIAACLLWPARRGLLLALAAALLYWQWVAPVANWAQTAGDPSTAAGYYAPLVAQLRARQAREGPFRVEIPFTENHWETRWVAPVAPLARGWERQLDIQRNGLFYDGALTAARYRAWLDEQGVRYVALPDAPADGAGRAEAALVGARRAGLREVWSSRHWRLFAVPGARGLARGAARVTRITPDRVELRNARPGRVDLRVRFTPYWALVAGRGCVGRSAGGWTRLDLRGAGRVVLEIRFALRRIGTTSARCTGR
ncbi:MAG: hypothetical protein ACXVSX_11060 [Solirubrobacteraceae bacterium]